MDVSTSTTDFDPSPGDPSIVAGPAPRPMIDEEPASLFTERLSPRAMIAHQLAWSDLAARSLERNVFLEPAFALPLLQHAGGTRCDFVLVWERDGPTCFGRLVGLLPLASSGGMFRRPMLRGFSHRQANRATPLIDRGRAREVFAALLDHLREHDPAADALLLEGIDGDGGLLDLAAASGVSVRRLDQHQRAILPRRDADAMSTVAAFGTAKRRKEIRRQTRRLSEVGERRYVSARAPAEVAAATERFLALEGRGWKGERGTALIATPRLATFTRAMTRLMAHDGKCRIDAIEIDGRPVAMGIVLSVGDHAYFWKTAFDESYGAWSPGVQFAIELGEAQLADPTIAVTDSCAVPDHPMIDRVWPARMTVVDALVALRPEAPARFEHLYRFERARGILRAKAKRLYRRLSGRS